MEEYIINKIKYIKEISSDSESAHSEEDDLREWFIDQLSKRDDEIGRLAVLVLTTKDIHF